MQKINFIEVAMAIPWDEGRGLERRRITRQELAKKFGVSDRVIRKAIEEARNDGCFIINEQDGSGYYRTQNLDILERQYKQDTARAMAILKRRKAIRQHLRMCGRDVK